MEFRILGPLEVTSGGRPVVLSGSRERTVLALLLLSPNRAVSRERLIDELWGDKATDRAAETLRVFVSRLRKAIRDGGGDATIVSRAPGYLLEIDGTSVDAVQFEALVAQGRDEAAGGRPADAAVTFGQALALWRGPALSDAGDAASVRAEAARLEEARLGALEDRMEAELASGRHTALVPELDHLTGLHPLRERLWGQRMLALYRSGRQADALRAYQDLRRLLADELGLAPGPDLARLESAILRHDSDLDLAPDTGRPAAPAPTGPLAPGALAAAASPTTFLFSDIEASTRRWEGDPERMAADLARHDALLREAVEASGGSVFSHTGDGMGATFASPANAFDAAVSAQRSLAAAAWAAGPLRVRMAIHAGTAEQRDGNFFGPALNRVARLMACASGGQVLCSQPAVELVGADLPAGVGLVDLGEHRLADLARPERILQVTHPDLPSEFPPLRTAEALRHNLPVALTSFVGRQRELEELAGLLGTARLLTLIGVGGAGKTRLGLEVAMAALDDYPDGVWMIELAPLREEAQVPVALAGTLSFETSAAETPEGLTDRLVRHLTARRALFLFDNCEHLLEPVARLVHGVLTHAPGVRVVATSREVLGVAGELAWRVPPLSLPPVGAELKELADSDAIAVFCERARAARAGFELDPGNATAVARICRRLDGIPLALELAAARVGVLNPAQVADRLDDRFRLLTGRDRITVPRHHTLRATVDWSYELLSAEEQGALARLSVFADTFDLEAAEAVTADVSDDAVETISRLVDKSLVVVHSEEPVPRYRLLETIREYGAEKLAAAGEETATHRRHCDHFVARVQGWQGGPLGADWLNDVFSNGDNFRAALEWAWSADDFDAAYWLFGGLLMRWYWLGSPDGPVWARRIRTDPRFDAAEFAAHAGADVLSLARIVGLYVLGVYALLVDGSPEDCEAVLDDAKAVAARLGDDDLAYRADFMRGELRLVERDPAARLYFESALASSERMGKTTYIGWCHDHLGWAAIAEGDLDLARSHFEQSVALARGDPNGTWLEAHALAAFAPLVARAGDHAEAARLAEEAISTARRLPARPVLAMTLTRAADAATVSRQLRRAAAILVELLGVIADLGSRRYLADALELAAVVLADTAAGDGPASTAEILGAARALRDAALEPSNSLLMSGPEIERLRSDLPASLGPDRFAEHDQRGRSLPPEAIAGGAVTRLREAAD